jgi:hypothetical protein
MTNLHRTLDDLFLFRIRMSNSFAVPRPLTKFPRIAIQGSRLLVRRVLENK